MSQVNSRGYVEVNGVRVADFESHHDPSSAAGPGLHLFTLDYHCQVTDHLRLYVYTGDGMMTTDEAHILNYFLLVSR